MRLSSQALNPSLKKQVEAMFAQVIADLRDLNEANNFLKDFFNENEYESFSKRLALAYWIKKGRSYRNIKDNLKVSSATIASAQSFTEKPGIKLAIKKVEAEEWANQWAEKIKNIVKR